MYILRVHAIIERKNENKRVGPLVHTTVEMNSLLRVIGFLEIYSNKELTFAFFPRNDEIIVIQVFKIRCKMN